MCERLRVECVCGDSVSLDSPVTGSGRDSCPALLSCPRAKPCGGFPLQAEDRIYNSMELLIRSVSYKGHQFLSYNIQEPREQVLRWLAGVRGPGLHRADSGDAAQIPESLPCVSSVQGVQHVPGEFREIVRME